MTLSGFLLLVVVGAICGGITEFIVGVRAGGLIRAAVVGALGALIGVWLAPRIGLPSLLALRIEDSSFEVVWSILGAMVLLLALSALWPRDDSWWEST